MRLDLTLDDEHAAVLTRLAERTHSQLEALAQLLLLAALDRAVEQERQGGVPRDVAELLDGIEGAYERMVLGRRAAADGDDVVPLDQV